MPDKSMKAPSSWGRRVAWLLGIWAASVGALALAAWLLRLVMDFVGMTAGHL